MSAPEIGQARTLNWTIEIPCQDDSENWQFEFTVIIRRISKTRYDYYISETNLPKMQGTTRHSSMWYVVKMTIHNLLYKTAYQYAVDWNTMDNEKDG